MISKLGWEGVLLIDVEVADGGNRIGKMLVVARGSSHTHPLIIHPCPGFNLTSQGVLPINTRKQCYATK